MELTDYEHERRSDRQMYVKIHCEVCGNEKWVRWTRVKEGRGRFCGMKCYGKSEEKIGIELAYYFYDASRNESYAHWKDEDGKQHSTTYARWLWQHVNGEIPDGYRFRWRDENPQNAVIENVEVVTPEMFSQEASERLLGHTFTETTLQKMSEKKKGVPLSDEHKKNISISLYKRWDEGEFDDIHVGENNSHWRGGVENSYPKEFSNRLKSFIKERDKNRCRICEKLLYRTRFAHIHHINGNRLDNDPENLILLCKDCHSKVHAKTNEVEDILAFRSKLDWNR